MLQTVFIPRSCSNVFIVASHRGRMAFLFSFLIFVQRFLGKRSRKTLERASVCVFRLRHDRLSVLNLRLSFMLSKKDPFWGLFLSFQQQQAFLAAQRFSLTNTFHQGMLSLDGVPSDKALLESFLAPSQTAVYLV